MRILGWEEFLQDTKTGSAVAMTIGVFDGLHAGHQALIGKVVSYAAAAAKAEPWVITFRDNPKRFLRPESYPGDILPFQAKLDKLAALGICTCIIIDFSAEFGKLKGGDFLSLICGRLRLCYLSIGEDFHFGCRMDTNAEKAKAFLAPLGVRVEILPPVYHEGSRISSTRIRGFIQDGDFRAAASMLGHPYRLELSGRTDQPECAARTELTQVVPRAGRFPALFEGTAGRREGFVDADGQGISWHYDGNVEAITFI
ncbi:MAG: FAD synthetase family protein [Spirochaetales bacterium]|jgi:riboflavin kinase/FMN adenylyltransferase|nr:FAD synthetase family protein [Spirochaetales bacterium]